MIATLLPLDGISPLRTSEDRSVAEAKLTVSQRIERFGHTPAEVEVARRAAERVRCQQMIGPQTGGRDQRFPSPSADEIVTSALLEERRTRLVLALALAMAMELSEP